MKLLHGKTALVTGASKGIGRSIALKFAEQGAHVAFTYLSSVEQGQALEAELASKGVKAKGYRSDASDFAQADKLINEVVAEFGSLDILVNNAGITMDNLYLSAYITLPKVLNASSNFCVSRFALPSSLTTKEIILTNNNSSLSLCFGQQISVSVRFIST